ncbi:Coenzyme F420 hydrogenase [Candidatus Defluviicoccus seviourii]|uniref:Coenzyme F420 hydrogenase n=1 Tax=Candidatus Defluviicoccus seviourii TaxID=2565273 RepID=A0A564WD01_9PROT|nr:Coenzyme F420 hydrogenase [Candidatus Defluviicoccus seviourii]
MLEDTVLRGGYCVGCGACTAVEHSPYKMAFSQYGMFSAENVAGDGQVNRLGAYRVCPFSESDKCESRIASTLYGSACNYDEHVGYYQNCYAGFVNDFGLRSNSSSGGMVTWLSQKLLREGFISAVIHVGMRRESDKNLFSYCVSFDEEQIFARSKTRYYPIEMSVVLDHVRRVPGRYLFVGLPCFSKAVRLLQEEDRQYKERIPYVFSLFCGHLKSSRFSDNFAWQQGIFPGTLSEIDFRHKLPDRLASDYAVEMIGETEEGVRRIVSPARKMFGSNWGHMFFAYKACDYCDDIVGECSDASFGDAWLPQFVNDPKGTSIVITRNIEIQNLVAIGMRKKELMLYDISNDALVRSQAGNFRHRRDGLSYRLYKLEQKGIWHPPKRVQARYSHLDQTRRAIYDLRQRIRRESHTLFLKAIENRDYNYFVRHLSPLTRRHDRLGQPLIRGALGRAKRLALGLLHRLKTVPK